MNVDYLLKPSPATARKLAYLRSIMRLDIDDDALRLAGEGLLTEEQAVGKMPEALKKFVNERSLDLMQHSLDHNARFVFGTRTFPQSAAYSLMAALVAAERVLILHENSQQAGDEWRRFLNTQQIDYCHVRTEKDKVDLDCAVLLVPKPMMTHDVVNKNRDRVLVYVEQAGAKTFTHGGAFGSYSLDDLFVSLSAGYSNGLVSDHALEFQKVVQSFHTNPNDAFGKPVQWWNSSVVQKMVQNIHPKLNIANVLAATPQNQNNMLKMGFILSAPAHIGKMLGIHVRYLVEDQARPREDELPN